LIPIQIKTSIVSKEFVDMAGFVMIIGAFIISLTRMWFGVYQDRK